MLAGTCSAISCSGLTAEIAAMTATIKRKIDVTGAVLGIGIDVVGLLQMLPGGTPQPLTVIIGTGLIVFFMVRLASSYKSDLDAYVGSRPRLEFNTARQSAGRLGVGSAPGNYVRVWQLWFVNRPIHNTPAATARQVTAHLQFYNEDWSTKELEFVGQWALGGEPDHVGWSSMAPAIDLPATHTYAKLQLVVETEIHGTTIVHGETVHEGYFVFGLSGENLHERPLSGAHVPYTLPNNATRVVVSLMGVNLDQTIYRFAMTRSSDSLVTGITVVS